MILYQPPTIFSILRGAAINLILPFVNGLMLGFGELFAHEAAFRLGWSNTKVGSIFCQTCRGRNDTDCQMQVFPAHRNLRPVGPGIAVRDDPVERKRRDGEEMDMWTSME